MTHSHRPGALHQSNKKYKSKYASKSSLKSRHKGKVPATSTPSLNNSNNTSNEKNINNTTNSGNGTGNGRISIKKQNRKNTKKQLRQKKNTQIDKHLKVYQKYGKWIAVVPLCSDFDASSFLHTFGEYITHTTGKENGVGREKEMDLDTTTEIGSTNREYIVKKTFTKITYLKQDLSLLLTPTPTPTPSSSNSNSTLNQQTLFEILDTIQICDLIYFVLSPSVEVEGFGYELLNGIRCQGVPTCFSIVFGKEGGYKMNLVKKSLSQFMNHHLPSQKDMKLFTIQSDSDVRQLLRMTVMTLPRQIKWKTYRSYGILESISTTGGTEEGSSGGDKEFVIEMQVRNSVLDMNQPIHLPYHGEFPIHKLEILNKNGTVTTFYRSTDNNDNYDKEMDVLHQQEGEVQEEEEGMMTGVVGSGSGGTQSAEAVGKSGGDSGKVVPRGMSGYQAAWMDEFEVYAEDHSESEHSQSEQSDTEYEVLHSHSEHHFDSHSDHHSNHHSEHRSEIQSDDPFEKIAPPDELAQTRFRKYRGIQSLQTASKEWNRNESLPEVYQSIYDLDGDFGSVQRKVLKYRAFLEYSSDRTTTGTNTTSNSDRTTTTTNGMNSSTGSSSNSVPIGSHVLIYIKNIPESFIQFARRQKHVPIFQCFIYEHLKSLLHFQLQKVHCPTIQPNTLLQQQPPHEEQQSEEKEVQEEVIELKSKEKIWIQIGFRRYNLPISYSHYLYNNMGLYLKSVRNGGEHIYGSLFGHITYQSMPVILFRSGYSQSCSGAGSESGSGLGGDLGGDLGCSVIGSGVLKTCDPSYLILKQIHLKGYPTTIHPSSHNHTAIISHLFHHPKDVDFYKPIELVTSLGKKGHIVESVGMHGNMKVRFERGVCSDEVVILRMYKRVFPKWGFELE